jgi:hypothetical protein
VIFWFCNHSACLDAEALWLDYKGLCCGYHNIVWHISTNKDDILFEVTKIYLKGGVVFIDVVKESVSRDKSLPPFLSGHHQILEEIRLIVYLHCERWSYI